MLDYFAQIKQETSFLFYCVCPRKVALGDADLQGTKFEYHTLFRVKTLLYLVFSSSSLSLKCALREDGCRIGYEATKVSRDHFWRSIFRDTNVEVSALYLV